MSRTLAPADVSHYYQRLAELSTLPSWQREEFTEPAGPERGHLWHWQDVYPSSPGPVSRRGRAAARAQPEAQPAVRPIHDAFGLFQAEEEA